MFLTDIIVGISSAGDHTHHHHTSFEPSSERDYYLWNDFFQDEVLVLSIYSPIQPLAICWEYQNIQLSIRQLKQASQLVICVQNVNNNGMRAPDTSSVTLENCLAFSSWFQHRKGYASLLRERGRVYRQSSPVSGRRSPWWIMLPNNGSGLSQSEHAPIAGRHTNMPLSPIRIDIVPWQMQVYSMSLYLQMSAPVSDERQIKSRLSHQSISTQQPVARMASHA